MKKLLTFGLFIISSVAFSQNYTVIDSSYSSSFEKPILILSGKLVKFEADSIYLVNKPRLRLYEDIRNNLMSLDFDCDHTISLYKESLAQNSILADKLIDNSANTNRLNSKLLTDTQAILERNRTAISKSIENLESAQINLELAKDELDRIKTNTFFDNLLYGLAGIGIGILVGVSLN